MEKNSRGYDRLMNEINVTPEMRARILNNVRARTNVRAQTRHKRPWLIWTPVAALSACALLVLFLQPRLLPGPGPAVTPPLVVALPPTQVESLLEAANSVSYPLTVPGTVPDGYTLAGITVYPQSAGSMVAIQYANKDASIEYRVAPGTDDISGDYSEYAVKTGVAGDGAQEITLAGDAADEYRLATWTDGEMTYAITTTAPLTQDALLAMAGSVAPYAE